jgi:hypothetical protein
MSERLTRSRFRELVSTAAAIIGIWLLEGVYATSEIYGRALAWGVSKAVANEVFYFQMASSFVWATVTPLIAKWAETFPIRRPHATRNTLIILASLPVFAVIRAAAGGAIHNLAENDPVSVDMIQFSIASRTHRFMVLIALIILITNLLMARRDAAARERNELRIRTLLDRSQLDRIRTQLQPHFVFATLQATSDVLEHDPAAADAMVVGLSDLLRRSLAAGDEDVPLSSELDMIDRYLELHRIGLGNNPVVTLDVEEDVLNAAVPPMVLQPLVEHAVALAREGEVHVHGCREGATLRIDIRYSLSVDTASAAAAANTIDLTRARLRQLYADQQSFDVSTVPPFVIIAVRIPFREMAARESDMTDRERATA